MIKTRQHESIVILEAQNPPVNALSHALRQALLDGLEGVARASTVEAVVLAGAGRLFMSGADIAELDQPIAPPGLLEIEAAIHAIKAPVIAAVHGPVLGGGLLLALMCDYRIATSSASFAFPEVELGLLPTFGGTQILPRVTGVANAVEMIVTGARVDSSAALKLGLIDEVAAGEPLELGVAFAQRLMATAPLKRRLMTRPLRASDEDRKLLLELRARTAASEPGFVAPVAAFDALLGGFDLSLADALKREEALFEDLRTSAQSRVLRTLFFAERRAAREDWSSVGAKLRDAVTKHLGERVSKGLAKEVAGALLHYGFRASTVAALIRSAEEFEPISNIEIVEDLRRELRQFGQRMIDDRVVPDGSILNAICVKALGWPRYRADLFS